MAWFNRVHDVGPWTILAGVVTVGSVEADELAGEATLDPTVATDLVVGAGVTDLVAGAT